MFPWLCSPLCTDKYDRFYPPSSPFPPTAILATGVAWVAATFYKVRDFPASMRTRILRASLFLPFPPASFPPSASPSLRYRSESLFPIAFVFPGVSWLYVAFQLLLAVANTAHRPYNYRYDIESRCTADYFASNFHELGLLNIRTHSEIAIPIFYFPSRACLGITTHSTLVFRVFVFTDRNSLDLEIIP